ncbi:MAG: hypothetical protein V5B38_05045 [Candidatus Accumulibacter propinquus]|jgi:hypothetical protein
MALITRIDCNNSAFQRSFRALQPDIQKEARTALALLIMADVSAPPARLHLHTLKSKLVPSSLDASKKIKVYTFHLTSNDAWKASFTLEEGTAYLRACGPHDRIDSSP